MPWMFLLFSWLKLFPFAVDEAVLDKLKKKAAEHARVKVAAHRCDEQ